MAEAVVRIEELEARLAAARQDQAYAVAQTNMALGRVRMLEELIESLRTREAAPPPPADPPAAPDGGTDAPANP